MPERTPSTEVPKGVGVDALPHTRPGVPRERPQPDGGGAYWERPAPQRGVELLGRQGLRAATPVFGTAQPPRGLSGLVRRAAYRIPEHRASRWALLLVGDRLDVLGHRVAGSLWLLPAGLALAVGYATVARTLGRR
jgi:hypothetical protein